VNPGLRQSSLLTPPVLAPSEQHAWVRATSI